MKYPAPKKNVYILSFNGSTSTFIPVLWPSAKTYYEMHGAKKDQYNWVIPTCEFYTDITTIKNKIKEYPPSIFGVSLYVWNYEISLEVCEWVKNTFPDCLIITGGPQQYFKHNDDWFLKYDFIDASLPSEAYGELTIKDILDNLNDDNTIDWTKVEKIYFPLKKDRSIFVQSPKNSYKLDFKWNFSAFEKQKQFLDEYVCEYNKIYPNIKLQGKLETTRGCPYQCTFCDWGGGVGTKVILKDLDVVKKDIDILCGYNISGLFMCDANFGINKERDIAVIQALANKKKSSVNFPFVEFGGMAKTNLHFDYLKQIYIIQAENHLSLHHKLSVQSFDQDILKNIKRTDLRVNEHWELADYMNKEYNYKAYVELIIGLPGTTVDSWCEEFTIPYEKNALVTVYEWHLLPEAEAYSPEYRRKFEIGTAKKIEKSSRFNIPAEIVVQSSTFTRNEYKKMWIISSINSLLTQGNIYAKSIKQILKRNNITFGQFLKKVYDECYVKWKNLPTTLWVYEKHLNDFISQIPNNTLTKIHWNNQSEVFLYSMYHYLTVEYFKNFDLLDPIFTEFLLNNGANKKTVEKENQLIIHEKNLGKIKFKNFKLIRYTKYKDTSEYIHQISLASSNFNYDLLVV